MDLLGRRSLKMDLLKNVEAYNDLNDTDKNDFVRKYLVSGGAKTKDWSWASSYKESTNNQKTVASNFLEVFVNRNGILAMNHIDPYKVGEEEANRLCGILVADSAKSFGFEPKTIPHTEASLVKHLYVHAQGTSHSQAQIQNKVFSAEKDISRKMLQDAQNPSGGSNVKLEFPKYGKLKEGAAKLQGTSQNVSRRILEINKVVHSMTKLDKGVKQRPCSKLLHACW